ncbi:histidine phosphatase family protein [Myxococcus stipitatus]|nr:histidine phosphatase family protein [Myxococcus stipitatus]
MYEPRSCRTGGGTLRIFLVRHGDADAEIPEGLGDEARALTAKARANMAAHFAALSERMGPIGLILTSPLVRTVQTAQILSFVSKHEGLLRAHRCLLPDMPVGAVEPVLEEHADENLVLVGHQPSMGALAAHLLGMQSFPKPVNPGTVIALERPEGDGTHLKFLFYAAPGQQVLDVIQ